MTKELDNKNRIDGENILNKIFFISLVVSLIAVELIEFIENEKRKVIK